jgi:hypothetical protein
MTQHTRQTRRCTARKCGPSGPIVVALLALLAGCRTDEADVHRWANTQQGPRKIVAVLTHDKYGDALRVEAAMTLVTMKPRAGRKVGMDELVEGLKALPEAKRAALVTALTPKLEEGMRLAPPEPDEHGRRASDPSVTHKDAAMALLLPTLHLVNDAAVRDRLHAALADWALADFSGRMDDSSQSFSMAQVLAEVGAPAIRRLPPLIAPDNGKVEALATFVAELGDEEAKLAASERLVKVASEIDSDAWLKRKTPELQAANSTSGQNVEGERFTAQLAQYQEEELMRVLVSLRKVGGQPVVAYLLGYARDKAKPEKRRAACLAALEGQVDRRNDAQVEQLLQLAGADDTPEVVREQALRRVGELPRKRTAEALYALFGKDNWKIRWVAAELVLRTSEAEHVPEFMTRIGRVRTMAITEPIRYGKLMGELQGNPPVAEQLANFLKPEQPVPVRLSALGYFLDQGRARELALVSTYTGDGAPVPPCPEKAVDCEWRCEVSDGNDQKVENIRTVGDFVRFCVVPAIRDHLAPVEAASATVPAKPGTATPAAAAPTGAAAAGAGGAASKPGGAAGAPANLPAAGAGGAKQ